MKIRYVLLNAFGGGGTASTTLTNANTLCKRGHEVEVVSVLRSKDDLRFPLDPRITLTTLVDRRERLPKSDRMLAREPSQDVPTDENRYERFSALTDRRLRKYLKALQEGVVIGTRPGINIAVARFTSENVIRVGQEHLFLDIQVPKTDQWAAMQQYYPRLDAFVSLTSDDAQDYAEAFGIRTAAIPNAVRLSGTSASAQSLRESRTVIAAGRLSGQKGFERLVDAMANVGGDSGWQAKIFGAGVQEEELRQQIARTGSPTSLMGFTTDLGAELREAGIYAMTSRFEGFPMVMLEAMGAGLPVVTFAFRTGCKDLMTDGVTGLVVPQDDVDAFANALRALMADPDRRVAMGASARDVASQYSPEAIGERWEDLFNHLMAGRTGMRGLARKVRRRVTRGG